MAAQEQPQESDLEKMLKEYQLLQEQLRSMAMQVEQFRGQKIEMERAKEELEKSSGKVYISVGGIMAETPKEKALTDITDRHSLTETRLNSVNKQYNDMRAREKLLNEKITKLYKASQGVQ